MTLANLMESRIRGGLSMFWAGMAREFSADSGCHCRVPLGDSTGIVRDQGKHDMVVADVDIGMVAGVFGDVRDPVDERHRPEKVAECPFTHELSIFQLPFRLGSQYSFSSSSVRAFFMVVYLLSYRC